MKDKKTIAIVTLAAITAGFAIFSFVNNTSKLKANSKLKAEKAELNKDLKNIQTERDEFRTQRDQLDEKAVSYTNLRAHETREDRGVGGGG